MSPRKNAVFFYAKRHESEDEAEDELD